MMTMEIPYLKIIQQTQQTPNAIAVLHGVTQLTYAQLHHLSNQVANYLRDKGVERNTPVGIMTERNPLMLVGILGILKAGGAYVPLDPSYPAERIRYILDHAEIGILLTENALNDKLQDCLRDKLPLHTLIFLDNGEFCSPIPELALVDRLTWSGFSAQDPAFINDPDDLMTILYTSGSTGRPKGVMLNHRGYMNRLEWMQKTFPLTQGDRVAQKTSFCFDISVWELFWPLMEGATICPVAREIVLNPWEFAWWMKDTQINVMHFVPSLFGEFIGALEDEFWTFPDLRWLIFSGEALPLSFIQRWCDRYGMKTGLANLYGPTEASIDVTCHLIAERPDTVTIPIGKAIDNVYLKILDEQMQPVPLGQIGELCIGGIQLAKGYLKDPQRTAEAFRPHSFTEIPGQYLYRTGDLAKELPDGRIEYHGRIDNQVKIRGFRVELGEIESVLSTHPAVREAGVVAVDYGNEQKRLVAWVSGQEVNPRTLKQYLSRQLPYYTIPQQIHWLPSLPKNHNGKLDRKALVCPTSDEYLPLGSAQRWLVTYFESPYSWSGYSRFCYHQALNLEIFQQAFKAISDRHPALRTVFVRREGQWLQRVLSQPQPLTVEFFDGSDLSVEESGKEVCDRIQNLSLQLQLDRFPLLKILIVKIHETCYEIAIVAHHAIADMLSGSILFTEFWSAYDRLLAGKQPCFENASPPSYLDYVRLLQAKDRQGVLASHVEYWKSQFPTQNGGFSVPLDQISGDNIEASALREIFPLTKEQTDLLLRQAKQYYKCNLYTLLLAPLYQLMANWSNRSSVIVSHRSHGRDLGDDRTFWESIGDFAVNFPLGITIERGVTWEQTIKQLQEKFARLPMNGVTYDWIADKLPKEIYPDANLTPLRANYLGNRSIPGSDRFEFCHEERDRRWSPPHQKRTALLECFFYLMDGSLYLEIEYSCNFHLPTTIHRLGKQYLTLMDDLLANLSIQEVASEPYLSR
ncbi:amino acid adenylation domain-containing protein [Candidatus Gracilibacteria bacterium]|nr:amino acid adenylation domain-containing protein [Candidatus Gracilibacteria bacterium]NJM89576.1 amino acid adenylation domain-containing protein [Hydrococcus sp. RU_2_2]NJP21618.1 amino acid adenylation domain-containing protein [Hydrococcus sp. CRU_1_1]